MYKVLIAGLMTAVAVPLFAQVAAPPVPTAPMAPRAPMAMMADKVMTRTEVKAMVQAHFAKLDANHDGFVAGDEMHRGGAAADGQWKRRAGGDWAKREGPAGDPSEAFNRLDANRDGMLSREEFAKGREVRIERRVELRGAPGAEGARHGAMKGMRGHGMGMGGAMMKMADANRDGRVSLQEATVGALQHFDRVDANHDGRITPDERRAMHRDMAPMNRRNAG